VYDSIYAHQVSHVRRGSEVTQKKNYVQDKKDDIGVGIRSTALLFGDRTRPILTALSATSLSLVTYAGYLNSHGAPFYLGVSLAAAQLARIIYRTDYDQRQSCWQGFVDCGWSGFWIWMGALADYSLLMLA
jgi:4-hydroxybenzoate polyprenyltransferase